MPSRQISAPVSGMAGKAINPKSIRLTAIHLKQRGARLGTYERTVVMIAAVFLAFSASPRLTAQVHAGEPDYAHWNSILTTYYDPAKGMDYAGLKARDMAAVQELRQEPGRVNAASLNRKQQLAYWINVYNINTAATILENSPVN
ncbi:MAG: DUF547 domain-containing protein [Acidobacteriota bacterium]|nr:DUF547 domain-containing protein [Acidobacteriota bacterium]